MKTVIGIVISTKMTKTAAVRVDRYWRHPLYLKMMKRSKTYLVHNDVGAKEGDSVTIVEVRPMSKKKRWAIVPVVKKTLPTKPKKGKSL